VTYGNLSLRLLAIGNSVCKSGGRKNFELALTPALKAVEEPSVHLSTMLRQAQQSDWVNGGSEIYCSDRRYIERDSISSADRWLVIPWVSRMTMIPLA
jgi:hypothetical protein